MPLVKHKGIEYPINHIQTGHESFERLQQAVDEYIYFYNPKRYQKIKWLKPLEYRAQAV